MLLELKFLKKIDKLNRKNKLAEERGWKSQAWGTGMMKTKGEHQLLNQESCYYPVNFIYSIIRGVAIK